ncbi:unnamed protein product [Amoebophrya sp. A120]|nr:unnamed protein product [Amoebophrya sp. A120]|eukprot:GSA120T00023805001.1
MDFDYDSDNPSSGEEDKQAGKKSTASRSPGAGKKSLPSSPKRVSSPQHQNQPAKPNSSTAAASSAVPGQLPTAASSTASSSSLAVARVAIASTGSSGLGTTTSTSSAVPTTTTAALRLEDIPEITKQRFLTSRSRIDSTAKSSLPTFVCLLCGATFSKRSQLENHLYFEAHSKELREFAVAASNAKAARGKQENKLRQGYMQSIGSTQLSSAANKTSAPTKINRSRSRSRSPGNKEKGTSGAGTKAIQSEAADIIKQNFEQERQRIENEKRKKEKAKIDFSLEAVLGGNMNIHAPKKPVKTTLNVKEVASRDEFGMIAQTEAQKKAFEKRLEFEKEMISAETLHKNDKEAGLLDPDIKQKIIRQMQLSFVGSNVMKLPKKEARCILCREKFANYELAEKHCLEKHDEEFSKKYLARWQEFIQTWCVEKKNRILGKEEVEERNTQCPVCRIHFGNLDKHLGNEVWLKKDHAHTRVFFAGFKHEEEDD